MGGISNNLPSERCILFLISYANSNLPDGKKFIKDHLVVVNRYGVALSK